MKKSYIQPTKEELLNKLNKIALKDKTAKYVYLQSFIKPVYKKKPTNTEETEQSQIETLAIIIQKLTFDWIKTYHKPLKFWLIKILDQNEMIGIIHTDKEYKIELLWEYGEVLNIDEIDKQKVENLIDIALNNGTSIMQSEDYE